MSRSQLFQCTMAAMIGVLTLLSRPVFANEDFRDAMKQIAKVVQSVASQRGIDSVSVSAFTLPPNYASASGVGLKKLLIDELKKRQIAVARIGGNLGIHGEIVFEKEQFDEGRRIQVKAELIDRFGETLQELNARVKTDDSGDIDVAKGRFDVTAGFPFAGGLAAELIGSSIGLKPFEPVDDVIRKFNSSQAVVDDGFTLRTSSSSPFGVRIVVNGQPRKITIEGGHPFVELKKGETFKIGIVNGADFDAAVRVHLDGVSSFAFSEIRHIDGPSKGDPRYSRYIFKSGTASTIAGWHKNNSTVRAFKVTDFSEGAAALVNSPVEIGSISVRFQATWNEQQTRPSGEPRKVYTTSTKVRIGLGGEVEQSIKEDRDPREFGFIRDVITIRYEKP